MAIILIVDDSSDLHQAMRFILELDGHVIKTATSKALLMEELKQYVPDIIMLDVQLNGENGREICREIKANNNTSNVPVILMSANEIVLNDYQECGATGVIDKPFSLPELTEKINSVLK